MANERLIKFQKAWKNDDGSYSIKDYYFNPDVTINGMEPCLIKEKGEFKNCVKIFYPDKFLTLVVSMDDFIDIIRDSGSAMCLLVELYKQNITVKEFLKMNEGLIPIT